MQPNFPDVIDYTQRFVRTVPTRRAGTSSDCDQTYPITGVADYRPYVQKLKDCGAEAVFTTDLGTNFSNMLDAAKQIDFHPIWINTTTAYEQRLRQLEHQRQRRQPLLRQLVRAPRLHPRGHAPTPPTSSSSPSAGGDLSYSGGQVSTSSFLLWATAAKACGNDLTRDCVMTKLKASTAGTPAASAPPRTRAPTCSTTAPRS